MTELCIEVDRNDAQIGLRPKDNFYTGKYIHRSSHLILFNSKNEILLQQRSETKIVWSNLYTFSVDATVADESYEDCIQREMQEELGISISAKRLFTFPHFDATDKAWKCVFVGRSDAAITPDPRETQEVRWINVSELQKDITKNPEIYAPPFIVGMKKYFDDFYKTKK